MIPVFLIFAVINAALSSIIALRLYYPHRSSPQQPQKKFYMFYAVFALAWVSWSFAYIPKDLLGKGVFDLMGYMFLVVSIAELIQVPFFLKNKRGVGMFFSCVVIVLGIIYMIGRIMTSFAVEYITYRSFYMWAPAKVVWLDIVFGVAIAASAAIIMFAFYFHREASSVDYKNEGSLRIFLSKLILFSFVFIAPLLFFHTFLAYIAAAFFVAINLLITIFSLTFVRDHQSSDNQIAGAI